MANNFNLQLYPRAYRVKTIGVIIAPAANTNVAKSEKIFFDNDAELNNSTILGIRCDNNFQEDGWTNAASGTSPTESYRFTITLKDKENNTIVDSLPLASLVNFNLVGGGNLPQQNFKGVKTIKRFFIQTQFDKGYLTCMNSITIAQKSKFYLTIFYLPNNTSNFDFVD
jgi:hypothetical protein